MFLYSQIIFISKLIFNVNFSVHSYHLRILFICLNVGQLEWLKLEFLALFLVYRYGSTLGIITPLWFTPFFKLGFLYMYFLNYFLTQNFQIFCYSHIKKNKE